MAWILLYKNNVNDIINVLFGGIINENFIDLRSWNVDKFSKEKNCEKLESVIKDYDVILLGPQIAYKKDQLLEIANKYNKPLSTINPVDYGMGNGANILEQIKKMINE